MRTNGKEEIMTRNLKCETGKETAITCCIYILRKLYLHNPNKSIQQPEQNV